MHRPLNFDELRLIIDSRDLTALDVVRFCSINKQFLEGCQMYEKRLWTYLLQRDYPDLAIVGEPKSHYEKIFQNIGETYWIGGRSLMVSDFGDPNKYQIDIVGNRRPTGSKVVVALLREPDVGQRIGIAFNSLQHAAEVLCQEPVFIGDCDNLQLNQTLTFYPARPIVATTQNDVARQILAFPSTPKFQSDVNYWLREKGRFRFARNVGNQAYYYNPNTGRVVARSRMRVNVVPRRILYPLFLAPESLFAEQVLTKVEMALNQTLSATIKISIHEVTLS